MLVNLLDIEMYDLIWLSLSRGADMSPLSVHVEMLRYRVLFKVAEPEALWEAERS